MMLMIVSDIGRVHITVVSLQGRTLLKCLRLLGVKCLLKHVKTFFCLFFPTHIFLGFVKLRVFFNVKIAFKSKQICFSNLSAPLFVFLFHTC